MQATRISIVRAISIPIASRKPGGFRDIILPLARHANAEGTNAYALSVAKEFGASVSGLAFALEPVIPASGPFDAVPGAVIEDLIARAIAEAQECSAAFMRQAKNHAPKVSAKTVRASFHESEEYFAEAARSFDLAVVPQNKPDEQSVPNFAEAALFHSGRPVLVVPYIQRSELSLNRVLVCWDGSRAAARAVSDAWPLLERAKAVNVVTVGHGQRPEKMQQEFKEHLSKHGINADMEVLTAEDIDAGNAILSHAADIQADLLVMGGYGHSRLREWVLGGVTRTILQTMTVPTLLSH